MAKKYDSFVNVGDPKYNDRIATLNEAIIAIWGETRVNVSEISESPVHTGPALKLVPVEGSIDNILWGNIHNEPFHEVQNTSPEAVLVSVRAKGYYIQYKPG